MTFEDQWLDKNQWTLITSATSWTIQCIEGSARIVWAVTAPDESATIGLYMQRNCGVSGSGQVYARCAENDTMTRISLTEGVSAPLFSGLV